MATLTVQNTSRSGLDLAGNAVAADGAGNDKWVNDGTSCLYIKNGNAGSYTATFVITATVDGQTVTNRTVTLATGHEAIIGPFSTVQYNDNTGKIQVQHSLTSSVTLFPFKLGN